MRFKFLEKKRRYLLIDIVKEIGTKSSKFQPDLPLVIDNSKIFVLSTNKKNVQLMEKRNILKSFLLNAPNEIKIKGRRSKYEAAE